MFAQPLLTNVIEKVAQAMEEFASAMEKLGHAIEELAKTMEKLAKESFGSPAKPFSSSASFDTGIVKASGEARSPPSADCAGNASLFIAVGGSDNDSKEIIPEDGAVD